MNKEELTGKAMPQDGANGTPTQEGTGATTSGIPAQTRAEATANGTPAQTGEKPTARKPTHKERRDKILELLESKPYLRTQIKVREELEKIFGVEIGQTDISKDFTFLGIEKNDDGSFAVSESYIRSRNIAKLKKIAVDCGFYNEDICTEFKTLIIKSFNLAYSHMLGKHLKTMYPNVIIDTVCSENAVIVYHVDSFAFGKNTLDEDIYIHLPDPE